MSGDRGQAWARESGLLVAGGAAAALAVLLLAPHSRDVSLAVGDVGSGALATATAVVLALSGRRSGRLSALPLLGTAIGLWGLGQLVNGAVAVSGGNALLGLGDRVSLLGAPFGLLGLVRMPRPRGSRVRGARILLDATLLGACGGLLLWRAGFSGLVPAGHSMDGRQATALVTLVAELSIVAMLLLTWLRDLDRSLLVSMLGVAMYTGADMINILHLVRDQPVPAQVPAMWCLAMPLIGAALLQLDPTRPPDPDEAGSDLRVTTATTVVALAALLAALLLVATERVIDPVTLGFLLVVVVIYAAREVYGAVGRRVQMRVLTVQALTDPLTGLGNRRAMGVFLEQLDGVGDGCSVLSVDLDGFKEVNDLLGHTRGDQLLVAVAHRLAEVLADDARVFRIGGDEFAVVAPGTADRAQRIADAVLVATHRAARDVPGTAAVAVSASVGLARVGLRTGPDAGHDRLAVLVESGAALRAAKQNGRDRVESYDGAVAATHRRGLLLERRLRETLAAGALDVHYQPVVDLHSRAVVGVEALARWDDEVLGRVPPDEFIGVAERSGLVVELGRQVLERTLVELAHLPALPAPARIGVNVSAVQLRTETFADDVLAMLATHGLDPERFVVEVTESLFVDEEDGGVRHLAALRAAGVQVAIDDFGSGYSNLAYLGRLPATILKVDRSITAQVLTDPRAAAILRSVVDLGTALPIDIAVEGIETEAQHAAVRALGAGCGQGWLYGAAVPVAQLPALVDALTAAVPTT